jgi:hypothetical protein
MAADVAAMGTHILVVTDDDKPKADALAEELGMEIFSHRGNLRPPYYTIDSVRKMAQLFLSFPYVCPEPVLAKCSFLYIKWLTNAVFRRRSLPRRRYGQRTQAVRNNVHCLHF